MRLLLALILLLALSAAPSASACEGRWFPGKALVRGAQKVRPVRRIAKGAFRVLTLRGPVMSRVRFCP